MDRLFHYVVVSLALTCAAAGAHAQGDMSVGRDVAEQFCQRCHDINPGGAAKLYPPSFASIAGFRAADDIRWKIIAPPLHTAMPQLGDFLAPDRVDDLVAYITSLEGS